MPVPVHLQMPESGFGQAGEVHHLDTAFLLADGAWAELQQSVSLVTPGSWMVLQLGFITAA